MTRSGIEATLRALRYSGCFWKRAEFSRVEASSVSVRNMSWMNTCWLSSTFVGLLELRLRGQVRHGGRIIYEGCVYDLGYMVERV